MNLPIISSTFLLTLLMMVGLFFFIRASVKDRTEQIKLIPADSESETALLTKLEKYFESRSYKTVAVDPQAQQVTFQGLVRPSQFLAILLTALAGVGFSCLSLILALLFPALGNWCWLLLIFAPIAGIFYWKKAERPEKISLAVKTSTQSQKFIAVTGHRDELASLQQNLSLQAVD